jgi:hypothetical protein
MKKKLFAAILICLVFFTGNIISVQAIDTSEAQYIGTVRETNGSYTASNVCVPFNLDTQFLIDAGYLDSDCLDSTLTLSNGDALTYMPAISGYSDWILFDPEIAQNSSENFKLYLGGGTDMEGDIVYFPGDAGMTVADAASLEPGNNFEIETDGFIDTSLGSNKYLVQKGDNFYVAVSGGGEITAVLRQVTTTNSSNIRPSGDGSENAAGTYTKVNDGSDTTYNSSSSTSYLRSMFACTDFEPADPLVSINNVTVYFRFKTSSTYYTVYAKPALKVGGTVYEGTEQSVNTSWVTKSQSYTTSPATGQAWTQSEINSMELGYCYKTDASNSVNMADVWIVVNYTYVASSKTVSCSGIDSGEHNVKVSADGSNLYIYVDDVLKDTEALGGLSIANNSNGWEFFKNGSVLYLRSAEITIGGTLKGSWTWENDTTFTDLSGNSNNATPSFRVTSSDVDVSAAIITLESILLSEYETDGSGSGTGEIITTTIPAPDNLYSELDINLPGADLIDELLDAADIPNSLFWFPVLFGSAMMLGIFIFAFARDIMIQSLINGAALAFFGINGGLPFWVVIPFILMSVSVIIARKTVSM